MTEGRAGASGEKVAIPQEQWDLPASLSADGKRIVTLRELVDERVATMSLQQLSTEQRAKIVAKRIEAQPEFEVGIIGVGVVSKEQAIAEVRAQSEIGQALVEIEQRLLVNLLEEIENAHGET